jgi:hypothetical protein
MQLENSPFTGAGQVFNGIWEIAALPLKVLKIKDSWANARPVIRCIARHLFAHAPVWTQKNDG